MDGWGTEEGMKGLKGEGGIKRVGMEGGDA